jgi:hypothetical protein
MNSAFTRGLHLERRGVLLPWGSDLKTLFDTGEPQSHLVGQGVYQLSWAYESILGGLSCTVQGCVSEKKRLKEFTIYPEPTASPCEAYEITKKKMAELMGRAGCEQVDKFMKLPTCAWDEKDLKVTVSIFERFGEYCVLNIRHKGPIMEQAKGEQGNASH